MTYATGCPECGRHSVRCGGCGRCLQEHCQCVERGPMVVWAEEGGLQLRVEVKNGTTIFEVLDVDKGPIAKASVAHYRAQRIIKYLIWHNGQEEGRP